MESILALSVSQNASDVHLSSGEKVLIRQNGQLIRLESNILSSHELHTKLYGLLSKSQQMKMAQDKQLDFAYHHAVYGRFRVNVFYQQHGIAACLRLINQQPLTLDQICAPKILHTLAQKQQGLILITGATGSGKSTTLSAMINDINQHAAKHIITLEDPIELIYRNQQSLIQQREIGVHCTDYLAGLTAALRQDPDVIVIGELRDQATMSTALHAAQTGHLILATLHSHSAVATISRIIDAFPEQSRHFVRTQLAASLQGIVCQRLYHHTPSVRKANFEILINTPSVSHLIQEGKIKQLVSAIQTGGQYGMQLFEIEFGQ
ncbi:twitching motility protein PilT [Orbus hercynius]|uniref:Twitching motility protein PilT n=1 Tax=Orbus hercynius TaxID=593135 RepID=A0A495RJC8_9GAMM|nr:PilT/PilU family type 4a pilus ATPase [Orbus hercynius]RKS87617.1 twitching motility protein PilT [Orbus hercynius]